MISFVTTAFNEELVIGDFVSEVLRVCKEASFEYEIVIVDNGSFDRTSEIIEKWCHENPRIKLVQLSRNFGYQGGVDAAISHAKGDWIFYADSDLQDPPELAAKMLKKANEDNLDIVYGIRKSRDETFFRKVSYWLFYRLWQKMSEIPISLDSGDCCLISNKVAKVIVNLEERMRFFRGQRVWVGFKSSSYEYHRENRKSGYTKFSLMSAINLALIGLFSYSKAPLRLVFFAGAGSFIFSAIFMTYFLIGKILSLLNPTYGIFIPLPEGLTVIIMFMFMMFR
jgi:dolichol-phosphate mannosyltransferase